MEMDIIAKKLNLGSLRLAQAPLSDVFENVILDIE